MSFNNGFTELAIELATSSVLAIASRLSVNAHEFSATRLVVVQDRYGICFCTFVKT